MTPGLTVLFTTGGREQQTANSVDQQAVERHPGFDGGQSGLGIHRLVGSECRRHRRIFRGKWNNNGEMPERGAFWFSLSEKG